MVHEASLLHDDILDDADVRRGEATLVARKGLSRALVEGDHLLTASYRVAMQADSFPFAQGFARAVERTVEGEKRQGATAGQVLDRGSYDAIVTGKSGELFGCATALQACLVGDADLGRSREVGLHLGRIYQMVDDFLDYCSAGSNGKPPLQDFRQKKWTWVLGHCPGVDFHRSADDARAQLFGPVDSEPSPMRLALRELAEEVEALEALASEVLGPDVGLRDLIRSWLKTAEHALGREELGLTEALSQKDWLPFFARNSRTFRFAARLFPPEEESMVAGVYAFCRLTDDLVDEERHLAPEQLGARLDAWREIVERGYAGEGSGVPLVDDVLGEAARRGVPLRYGLELIEGVRMDADPGWYETVEDLRLYTFRVASTVGLWITEAFGIRDPWILARAEALGHAMQLTNILRDVGEDWRMGRVYLPLDVLERHGLGRADLERMLSGQQPIDTRYREALEELMAEADRHYELAMEALPALPSFFRRPVSVAARVYQGIHARIRANGYDNLSRRAWTRPWHKAFIGARALAELRDRVRGWEGLPHARSARSGWNSGSIASSMTGATESGLSS
jgi:phytoene synthase